MKKQYDFPGATIIILTDGTCREIPKFCPMLSIKRSRSWVADALIQLRRHKTNQIVKEQ